MWGRTAGEQGGRTGSWGTRAAVVGVQKDVQQLRVVLKVMLVPRFGNYFMSVVGLKKINTSVSLVTMILMLEGYNIK